jgi:hypothetical protein
MKKATFALMFLGSIVLSSCEKNEVVQTRKKDSVSRSSKINSVEQTEPILQEPLEITDPNDKKDRLNK